MTAQAQRLGQKIQELRSGRGLSQQELAAKLGVTHSSVSRWESGKQFPQGLMLVQLAQVFAVELGELAELAPSDARAHTMQAPPATMPAEARSLMALLDSSPVMFPWNHGVLTLMRTDPIRFHHLVEQTLNLMKSSDHDAPSAEKQRAIEVLSRALAQLDRDAAEGARAARKRRARKP